MVHDPKLRRRMTLTYAQYAEPDLGGITNAGRLIVAALHGAASHLFGRLQYVVDGMMVARAGVDIEELRARAAASGALLPLSTMLRLAGQIYGCEGSIRLLAGLGKAPLPLVDSLLISPGMVLAAKKSRPLALFATTISLPSRSGKILNYMIFLVQDISFG